jgi:hypothetical protein
VRPAASVIRRPGHRTVPLVGGPVRRLLGVPGVLEQKTSILCNILDLLIYIGHILIVSTLVMQTAEDGDENLFHGLNETLIIEKIKCFGPRWTGIKTIVFLHNVDPSRTDRRFLYVCYGNPIHSAALPSSTLSRKAPGKVEITRLPSTVSHPRKPQITRVRAPLPPRRMV